MDASQGSVGLLTWKLRLLPCVKSFTHQNVKVLPCSQSSQSVHIPETASIKGQHLVLGLIEPHLIHTGPLFSQLLLYQRAHTQYKLPCSPAMLRSGSGTQPHPQPNIIADSRTTAPACGEHQARNIPVILHSSPPQKMNAACLAYRRSWRR